MDFDDMLTFAYVILKKFPSILKSIPEGILLFK